jgi:hypothetical protein
MKRIALVAAGAAVILAGLYGPAYVGGELLPTGWFNHEVWWSLPTMLMLWVSVVGLVFCGGFLIFKGVTK